MQLKQMLRLLCAARANVSAAVLSRPVQPRRSTRCCGCTGWGRGPLPELLLQRCCCLWEHPQMQSSCRSCLWEHPQMQLLRPSIISR